MKHLLRKHIIVLFVLISASAYSQDSTKFIIGGGIGGSYNKVTEEITYNNSIFEYTEKNLALKGFFGFKISKNKILGADFGLTYKDFFDDITIQFHPFLRFMLKNNLFIHTSIGTDIFLSNYSSNTFVNLQGGVGIGYDIKLTDNVSLQPLFKCSYITDSDLENYTVASSLSLDFVYKF